MHQDPIFFFSSDGRCCKSSLCNVFFEASVVADWLSFQSQPPLFENEIGLELVNTRDARHPNTKLQFFFSYKIFQISLWYGSDIYLNHTKLQTTKLEAHAAAVTHGV